MRLADGLRNLVAGLGTGRDKAAGAEYVFAPVTQQEIGAAYRSSALARRIVDMPAEDVAREWRAWQAETDDVSRLEATEERIGLQRKVAQAERLARLWGGAAIYIGVGDEAVGEPLAVDRIGQGGLQHINVLKPWECTPMDAEMDAREPGYGRPRAYQMTTGTAAVEVHPSRIVHFEPMPVMDPSANSGDWGDSVLQTTLASVRNADGSAFNVASLIYEAKVDVVKIPEFTNNLRTGGDEYEQEVLKRWTLAMTGKGINGALMIDAEEDYQQKSASFGGLPETLDRLMQLVSAAAGIPMTLLFGRSPAGLNSTGEGDARAYYDRVRTTQSTRIGPEMAVLNECVIRSSLGDRPPEVHYTWKPLWQLGPKDLAEVGEKIAKTFRDVQALQAIDDEVLGRAVVTALTEAGAAPGLEAAYAEFYAEESGDG